MNAKRGDRVRYGTGIYYFRPNGSQCLLFPRLQDVADVRKAWFTPLRSQVSELTADELDRIDGRVPPARHPARNQPSTDVNVARELELTRQFIRELDGVSDAPEDRGDRYT